MNTMNAQRYSVRIGVPGRMIISTDDFALTPGKITLLFGESGIGKSLLLRAICGLLDPSDFEITLNEQNYADYRRRPEIDHMREEGCFVFQEPSTHLNPLQTLREQINEGSSAGPAGEEEALANLWKNTDAADPQRLLDIYPTPHRPSGGEKARVLAAGAFKKIARWIASAETDTAPLFVFDEPTGNLDNRTRDLFLSHLFRQFARRAFTGVVITHDYSIISFIAGEFPALERFVEYKELRRDSGSVTMRPFDPLSYRAWLDGARNKSESVSARGETILHVGSRVRVHGRSLTIGKDPECSAPEDLVVRGGSLVYLKAPSGEGKTTFVKAIMGLVRAEEFTATCAGGIFTAETPRSVYQRSMWGKKTSMVFQHADEALNGRATVRQVFDGLPTPIPMSDDAVREAMEQLFAPEEISGLLAKKVETLSGGQKQRVNLLRSLVLETPLLILDEPLSGLDFETLRKVLEAVEEKRRGGAGIILISHNEEIFDALARPEEVYYLRSVTG